MLFQYSDQGCEMNSFFEELKASLQECIDIENGLIPASRVTKYDREEVISITNTKEILSIGIDTET